MKPAVNDETPMHVIRRRVTFDSTPCSRKHAVVVPQQNENAAKDGNGNGNDHHDDAPNCGNCRCHYYYHHVDGFSNDERKSLCWYSPEDLLPCREDAKNAIQQLQTSLENGTLDNLPEHICLRGIEKYADAATRYRKQRIFIDSILQQQQQQQQQQQAMMNPQRSTSSCGRVEDLANLARYLSKPSIELALFYAGRCAAELALLRHEEEDEEDDEDEWEDEEEDFSCSSQMDARESKLDVQEQEQQQQQQPEQQQQDVCVDRKRKRSHMNSMPPRKVQCCE